MPRIENAVTQHSWRIDHKEAMTLDATSGLKVGTASQQLPIGLYVPSASVGGALTSGTAAGIMVGDFASSYATGSAIPFTAIYTGIVKAYGESTTNLTSAVNARVGVFRHLIVTASSTVAHETYGLAAQVCVKNTTLTHLHAGLLGTFEVSTAATVNSAYTYGAACIIARLGCGTSILTATKAICGVVALYNGGALASGVSAAIACDSTTATTWTYFLAASKCDYVFFAATGTAYENGVKITAITNVSTTASGVLKVKIGSTDYYIPLWAASQLDGE